MDHKLSLFLPMNISSGQPWPLGVPEQLNSNDHKKLVVSFDLLTIEMTTLNIPVTKPTSFKNVFLCSVQGTERRASIQNGIVNSAFYYQKLI